MNDPLDVLLLGSGGREHAIALSLSRSPRLGRLYAVPGNPGIAEVATCLALDPERHVDVVALCREKGIGLVVVGPEAPLVGGLVDALEAAGIRAFGPSQAAAQLEGSKGFTKDFCARHAIPTAAYRRCDSLGSARAYLAEVGAPIVVKADGLAAGKGVTVAQTRGEAEAALTAIFGGAFGVAGASVVLEAVLEGEEASFFALCDGVRALPFASAQDHKRVGDGDTGPNTGGMGAYSPAPIVDAGMQARIMLEIVEPTLAGMAAEGAPFKGALFVGLMIGVAGPQLIEFNVRFGDPETQAMLPRLEDDLLDLLLACAEGRMQMHPPRFSPDVGLCVVLAARGYPGTPAKGGDITGLSRLDGVIVTQAGTRRDGERLVADGGRVLGVTALGHDVAAARATAYAAVDRIEWVDGFCRRDIGAKALARVK